MNALQSCADFLQQHGPDCTLYTTCEPCVMCLGAIVMANIREIVFGMPDNHIQPGLVIEAVPYVRAHIKRYRGGVLAEECIKLFRRASRKRRPNYACMVSGRPGSYRVLYRIKYTGPMKLTGRIASGRKSACYLTLTLIVFGARFRCLGDAECQDAILETGFGFFRIQADRQFDAAAETSARALAQQPGCFFILVQLDLALDRNNLFCDLDVHILGFQSWQE